jgi:hypothetical protein
VAPALPPWPKWLILLRGIAGLLPVDASMLFAKVEFSNAGSSVTPH